MNLVGSLPLLAFLVFPQVTTGDVDCEVQTAVIDSGNAESEGVRYRCFTEQQGTKVYNLPDWVTTTFRSAFEAQPTNYIRIQGAELPRIPPDSGCQVPPCEPDDILPEDGLVHADVDSSVVEFSTDPFSTRRHRRRVASTLGESTVLMVRVTTYDKQPSVSSSTMSERAFGSTATLKTTFEDCSFGELKIQKASGNGINSNGVVEISINANIQGAEIFSLENLMTTALQTKIGDLNAYNHIAYCVPSGAYFTSASPSWLAYAYVGGTRSIFNDQNCGHLSKLAHEIGHNLGLRHSGEGNVAYGDQSGIMGYGYNNANYPVQCFNSAKNWQLGWYSDKRQTVNIDSHPWKGRLYGYVDYATASGLVLINIGDIYLQYNKIAEINRDTIERRNQVAITRDEGIKSTVVAGLDTSKLSTTVANFVGSRALVIEVCDNVQDSYYEISIRFDDQTSCCGTTCQGPQPTQAPTFSTSVAPVPVPTNFPTPSPTKPPTPFPTGQPVPDPTNPPTSFPTLGPTVSPTPGPTRQPTMPPSIPPTPQPTGSPVAATPDPTGAPSISPTGNPSALASTVPTRSSTPSSYPSSGLKCDDHPSARFPTNDPDLGNQRCVWLAARPEYQEQFCIPSHPAYKICEETCGACTDDCEDTEGTFVHHGINRPCLWLSLRLNEQDLVCVPDHEAMEVCPETCGTCDGTG